MALDYISNDIVSILIFVSPGFLTIGLVGKIYGTAIKMEQFERTTWSLIASVPIGILFFNINDIKEFDSFFIYFLTYPYKSLIEISLLSLILAILISILFKCDLLGKISQLIYVNNKAINSDKSVWDKFMKNNIGKPVIVKTKTSEFKGWLSATSMHEEKKEIVLLKPVIVDMDENGNSSDFPFGNQIILSEDIDLISVLDESPNQN